MRDEVQKRLSMSDPFAVSFPINVCIDMASSVGNRGICQRIKETKLRDANLETGHLIPTISCS